MTIVFPRRELVPDGTTEGLDTTVTIRMSANEIASKLIEFSKKPIAAPSANISGKPIPITPEHVANDFYGRIV